MKKLRMILSVFSIIGFTTFGLCVEQELTFPGKICQRNLSNYSACLKDAIQEAWPQFIKGLPEFNFPKLDPLLFDRHHASYDTGDVHADVDATNITTTGLKDSHFLFAKIDFADNVFRLEVDSKIPTVLNEGTAKIVGGLGPFRLNHTVFFNITSRDVKVRWIIIGDVTNDRWIIKHFRSIPTITAMKVYVHEPRTEEFMNLIQDFINEFWPILYRAMGRIIIDAWEPWLIDITNRLFSKVSFSKTFPI